MNRLAGEVEADIAERGLLPDDQTVLVAVSGGVDSVVLFEILRRLSERHQWKLAIVHFNHQLRGKDSDDDERFVQSLARRHRLRCIVGRKEVGKAAQRRGISVEMAGREARHKFLAAAARKLRASVALAHHADDQVELFLLRLLRGASAEGLAGMPWSAGSPADSRVRLVRPLLGRRKEELIQFARDWSVSFRPDRTNESSAILRNRIRRELIPYLCKRFQPGLVEVILRQAELCAADAEFLSQEAHHWLSSRRPAFTGLAIASQRRVIVEQLLELGIQPEFAKVESLRQTAGQAVQIDDHLIVRRSPSGTIERETPAKKRRSGDVPKRRALSVKLTGASGKITFGRYRIDWSIRSIRRGTAPVVHRRRPGEEWFDGDKVGAMVRLRTRRPGDRFQPLGMPAPCKLQDLLTNARIARLRRDELALTTDSSGTIWWVDGLRIGEACKVGPATRRILRWKWLLK